MTAPQDVTARLIDAFNRADWDRMRALLGPDASYQETGTGRRVAGEDYVALCQGWKDAFPDPAGEIRRTLAEGDHVAQIVHWTGTHQGTLRGPDLEQPATGKAVDLVTTHWARIENGKVAEVDHHIDLLTMLAQVGALSA